MLASLSSFGPEVYLGWRQKFRPSPSSVEYFLGGCKKVQRLWQDILVGRGEVRKEAGLLDKTIARL